MTKRQKQLIRMYVTLVIWALLVTPSLPTPTGLPKIRIDDLLLLLAPFLVSISLSRIDLDLRVVLIFLIAIAIELGIFSGAVLGYPASLADHFYIIRLLKYTGAVILASALVASFDSQRNAFKWFVKKTLIPGTLLVLVVTQQFFNLGGLNEAYVEFVAPTKYETLIADYSSPRPVGMTGNPNELSFLLGILTLGATWMALEPKENRALHVSLAFLFFFGSLVTLSRSGVFATLSAIFMLVGISLIADMRIRSSIISIKRRTALLVAGLGLLFFSLLFTITIDETLKKSIAWRFMPDNYGSFYARFDAWQEHLYLWSQNPFFGVGTLKHSQLIEHSADNEWILLLRTGGILLVTLVILLFGTGLFKNTTSRETKRFSVALVFGATLYMIPVAFFYSLTIMPLSLMLLTVSTPSNWRSITFQNSNRAI